MSKIPFGQIIVFLFAIFIIILLLKAIGWAAGLG